MYKTILFDLDGTLTDSKEGIIHSLIHTLNHFGLPVPAEEADLLSFIGPPLYDSFTARYQFTPSQCNEVLAVYREHYRGIGVYQNKLYPGVESMLTVLQEHGCRMALATAKGDWTANKVVDDFKLRPYISDVFASVPEKNRNYKHEIIAHALQEMDGAAVKETIMVGDRASDIHGAQQNGIDAIGVTYGYGSLDEIQASNPTFIAQTVEDLLPHITNGRGK